MWRTEIFLIINVLIKLSTMVYKFSIGRARPKDNVLE